MQPTGRKCAQCGAWKPADAFGWKLRGKRLAARCSDCRKANYKENPHRVRERAAAYYRANRARALAKSRERRVADPERQMWIGARSRAREKGLPFDLDPVVDVCLPKFCPVFGVALKVGTGRCGPDSPTLDRIDPAKGYVKGNVIVVSRRANTIKNDATPAELMRVARFYKQLISDNGV